METQSKKWIEETESIEEAKEKYLNGVYMMGHGTDAFRIVLVEKVEVYGGLIVLWVSTLCSYVNAKYPEKWTFDPDYLDRVFPGQLSTF